MAHPPIRPSDITGLVLAGGRGTRMGGIDKGLQPFHGTALALHALRRMRQQAGGWVAHTRVNANRNWAVYESWGAPVLPDNLVETVASTQTNAWVNSWDAAGTGCRATTVADTAPDSPVNGALDTASDYASALTPGNVAMPLRHAGPLAGFMVGLAHAPTPWLLTVPCDTPCFPLDLAQRLAHQVNCTGADMAMAVAPDVSGNLRSQPVFCLLHVSLLQSLCAFTQAGGRQVSRWVQQHHTVQVPFDQPTDDPRAFFNANTLAELQALEACTQPVQP